MAAAAAAGPGLPARGVSPGCLIPSACPTILRPGSPILGGVPWLSAAGASPSAGGATIGTAAEPGGGNVTTGASSDEPMSALSVGWFGMFGSVGEGSRGSASASPSGMLARPLSEEEADGLRAAGAPFAGAEERDAREWWLREAACPCPCPCARALTAWMTACASGPSYGLMVAAWEEVGEVKAAGGEASVCR